MPSLIATTVNIVINAPLEVVFLRAVPIDIPTIMQKSGILPGVAKVDNQTGAWDEIGQSRTITMTDRSCVFEELTAYDLNKNFSYRVSKFTGLMGRLVTQANGTWVFTAPYPDKTQINWTYAFTPKSRYTTFIVRPFVQVLWRGYIEGALERVKTHIETDFK